MTKPGWVVLFLLCCLCTLVRSDLADIRQNTTLSLDIRRTSKDQQEKLYSETPKASGEASKVTESEVRKDHQATESHTIASLSKKAPQVQTPTDLSKPVSKSTLHTVVSSSVRPTLFDDDDEYDEDDEFIKTESIQEARLARKKQQASAAVPQESPRSAKKPTPPPSDEPVMQGPEDLPADASSSPEPSSGLGTVGTALLSVGGVLMVAGITGGIFVWRAAQHSPPPPPQGKTELAIDLLDLESSSKDPPPPSEVVTHRSSGLDFNYSMEKLFNHTSRPPVSQSTAPPVITNPAHVASSIAEEKVQIDDKDLYAASPISIYFPTP